MKSIRFAAAVSFFLLAKEARGMEWNEETERVSCDESVKCVKGSKRTVSVCTAYDKKGKPLPLKKCPPADVITWCECYWRVKQLTQEDIDNKTEVCLPHSLINAS